MNTLCLGTQVTETCPECGHTEAYSKEIQVRVCDHGLPYRLKLNP